MNKKGNMAGIIVGMITLVFAVLILTSLAFPQARQLYSSVETNQVLNAHTQNTANTTTTLTYTDLELGTASVIGLNASQYDVNEVTGVVNIHNGTPSGTYTANYNYYSSGYIESAGTRTAAGVIILMIITGVVFAALRIFGAV